MEGSGAGNLADKIVPDEQGAVQANLAAQVLSAYKEAKTYRSTYDRSWDRWYRLYSGQHWDGPRPEWRSTPVVNFIFSTIETILPIMTDNNPQINVAPKNSNSINTASIMGTMRRMEVGDSLLLPGRKVTSLTSTIVQLRPLKYACRTVEGGVRVWRVA